MCLKYDIIKGGGEILLPLVIWSGVKLSAFCSLENCGRPVRSKNLCNTHYARHQRHYKIDLDSPIKIKQYDSLRHAFEYNSEKTDHGLIWTGSLRNGYGTIHTSGKGRTAHRVAWELVNGPIPPHHELDHDLGCPRNCVTVEHLTPRTKSDHARIGWERGQFEGNGWTEEARIKRTKEGVCILCSKEYTRDIKSKYCSISCNTKASNLRRKEKSLGVDPGTLCPILKFDTFSRKQVYEEESGICGICNENTDSENWHLDHIIPRARGGQHIRSNVQVSHPDCNLNKSTRVV